MMRLRLGDFGPRHPHPARASHKAMIRPVFRRRGKITFEFKIQNIIEKSKKCVVNPSNCTLAIFTFSL
ncbi:MAG: hypothetical protein ACREFK_05345 [Stellaceae bacterium]